MVLLETEEGEGNFGEKRQRLVCVCVCVRHREVSHGLFSKQGRGRCLGYLHFR